MDSLNSAPWRKSTYSGNNGGNCVEADAADAWERFVGSPKVGTR
jgi:Domain of unknown function (DUF397)